MTLNNTSFTKGGMVVGSNQLVVPTTGYYLITAGIAYSGTGSGESSIQISVNGSVTSIGQEANNSGGTIVNVSDIQPVTAGQTIGAATTQNSGGSLSTYTGGSPYIFLAASLVSV